MDPSPDEPLGHIRLETKTATEENRPLRHAYREVPLTGCHNSLLPSYRQPHLAFQTFPVLDDFGCHTGPADARYLPTQLPWQLDENDAITSALSSHGRDLTSQEFEQDAKRFAHAFCVDARALHGHNHDHNCSFTCIKYAKAGAKKVAEGSLGTEQNIVCRFNYYVVKVFQVIEDCVAKVVRVRRQGKDIIAEPYIADTNAHNELGRVQVVRLTPFRGPTSDVGQCGIRCNMDFQFMPRAAVLTGDLNMDESCNKKGLSYDKAEAFYGIRLQLPHDVALRQAARSMLAMWQAAHNTDFT